MMTMWNHLAPRNIICLQRMAAIRQLDNEIQAAHREDYMVDVDRLLDERRRLMTLLSQGPIA